MRLINGERLYAATDLVDFLACAHLTSLKVDRLEDRIDAPPPRPASTADLATSKGMEHEEAHLAAMRSLYGEDLVVIESDGRGSQIEAAAVETRSAMEAGAPLIYQATLLERPWMGYADFIERVEGPSALGDWSYIPIDTKLARSIKPYFVVQLCSYAELIGEVQGVLPERIDVILGDNQRHSLLSAEFRAYYERMKHRFLAVMDSGLGQTYPLPVEHCEVCDWAEPCEAQRVADDHLSQVANLGRSQAIKFEDSGLNTVAQLAGAEADRRPRGLSEGTFEKLRSQAALQVAERESGERALMLLEPDVADEIPPRGFGLLPPPSPGDLFFDIEGDPFYDEGLEYLWGISYEEEGELSFRSFWGLDHGEERRAFEEFVDFVFARRERFPEMHVYHYAPYERTALGRLMGRYATREEEVDRLFRERVLVDLYRVVEQSMQISRPSYSLKEVEDFYELDREAAVKQAGDSVLMFEQWRLDRDQRLLDEIEAYNKEDCDSTLRLREWLVEQRGACEAQYGVEFPWRSPGEPEELGEDVVEAAAETVALQARLLAGVSEKEGERSWEQADLWLLAQLLDYHRREAKPGYWEFFDRLERSDTELIEQDREAIGGLVKVSKAERLPPPAKSSTQRFSFPAQDHKIGPGSYKDPHSCGLDPLTGESDLNPKSIEVLEVRDQDGTIDLKLSDARLAEEQTALIPGGPIPTPLQRAALRDFALEVAEVGLQGVETFRAGRDILCRALPRTSLVASGEPLQGESADQEQIKRVVAGLQGSYLFIQGPPGSGKTFTGSQVIVDLIASGRTVGVTANSHKAINNLLTEVEKHALSSGVDLRGLKKSGGGGQDFVGSTASADDALIDNSKKNSDFEPGHELNLIAGTAWLWCRESMRNSVDCLLIDEAGQISLADAIAISTAANNLVLLGDPLQLAQVSQGTHPPGSGVSVLEHLLGEQGTIPVERGVFLEQTRRMHPDVCRFVSEAFYEERLSWEPSCELQALESDGLLSGTGVRSIPVIHRGNARQSPEEAEVIAEQIEGLAGARFTDHHGDTSELGQEQVMVVTPFNAQVRCLRQCLDDRGLDRVEIGTVDKFQGQQAAVVFFSMATSSGAEIPRNVEFLYSRNRLNVAVSRAQCMAVLVASPELMSIECHTVEQMRLVNALCLLDEMGHAAMAGSAS